MLYPIYLLSWALYSLRAIDRTRSDIHNEPQQQKYKVVGRITCCPDTFLGIYLITTVYILASLHGWVSPVKSHQATPWQPGYAVWGVYSRFSCCL
jgi:hypothetical protein